MAYTPTVWKDGDTITADKLNKLEGAVENEQVGPKGDKGDTGAAGLSVKSLALTTTDGKVTAGTVTLSDDSTAPVTVTEA
ncbi:hypothetical protein [Lactococcus lactis]|uniref:hypothetical protein n=1 Tax=Lactococcus lactis TaxID=1358 RepID=UPI001D18332B|nr:hypothetical protein [Lactococcus lactis]MCC4119861.1 hypothetical protein [Lactococcus lactis]